MRRWIQVKKIYFKKCKPVTKTANTQEPQNKAKNKDCGGQQSPWQQHLDKEMHRN